MLLIAAIIGIILGSFLNVLIYRGPSMWGLVDGDRRGDLASPRSYCPACKAPIPFYRLIPLVSYFLQSGKCADCGAPIPVRYPIVEALGGAVALASFLTFGATASTLAAALLGFALITLAFIDLETGYLPDAITLPLIAAGLLANAPGLFVPFADAAIGAAAGYVAFLGLGALYQSIRGREGLGQGDAKLMAAIGAWSGWSILPFVVFAGALATLGAVGATKLAGKKTSMDQPIPFGPGLCAAGFVVFLFAARSISAL